MPEETFDLIYRTNVDAAKPGLDYLRNATVMLSEFAAASGVELSALGTKAKQAAVGLTALDKAIDSLTAKKAALIDLVLPFEFLETALGAVRAGLTGATAELKAFAGSNRDVGRVTSAMAGLADAGGVAKTNVVGVTAAVTELASVGSRIGTARTEMVGFQRSAYGASKSVEEAGVAVGVLTAQSAGLKSAGAGFGGFAGQVKGFGSAVDQTTPKVGGLGSSMLGLQARIIVFQGLKAAVMDLGKAITDARDKTNSWADSNLALRDQYRELANLQGKAEPDDTVVGGALRFRIATGLSNQAANDVLRRFEGELPAAQASGNITGNATSGVAGDYLREATRTGLRVGLSGSTTGLLAAKIAMSEPIRSPEAGLGKFQTVVDLLNRGSGDLTPLTQSLINTAGGTVGTGLPFRNMQQLAAAMEVTSQNATPAMAGTRVRQAATGMNRLRLGDAKAQLTEEQMKNMTPAEIAAKQGTGVSLGFTQDDFSGNIQKLGTYLDTKPDREAALIKLGLKNQTERRSLLQLTANRGRLATETAAADKGVDPAAAQALNAEFFKGDTAQLRISEAKNDASEFVRARGNEKLQVARKAAEERLRTDHKIDTPATNFDEAMADNPATRLAAAAAMKLTGKTLTADVLPVGLGGKPARQIKIDTEAFNTASAEARRVGVDPVGFVKRRVPDDAPFEERYNALATEVQRKGGNPFGSGGGQTDQLLQVLIREVQRGNAIQAGAAKVAAQPAFLPVRPVMGRGVVNDAIAAGLAPWGL
jgi:hypothetical protein